MFRSLQTKLSGRLFVKYADAGNAIVITLKNSFFAGDAATLNSS
jgi:hypothetical protein